MSAPLLVVVQGAPGSGKSTLVNRLRQDIDLPILSKDDLKELMFDKIPQSDHDFVLFQGAVAVEQLHTFARMFLQRGYSVGIEGAFWTNISRKEVESILDLTGAKFLEIYCRVDELIRQKRISQRAHGGSRHSGHTEGMDNVKHPASHNFEKLALGDYIEIDTSQLVSDGTYREIVSAIQTRMEE